jgi:hypothetical protein
MAQDASTAHGAEHSHHRGESEGQKSDAPAGHPGDHCSSASFAPPGERASLMPALSEASIGDGASFRADFVADRLDRPPLAL